jgi:hypothetical protein
MNTWCLWAHTFSVSFEFCCWSNISGFSNV